MAKPTVLFIHGSWHTASHFEPVCAVFEKAGYPTSCPNLPSTQSLPTIGLNEDAECIASELARLVEVEEKDVIVVAHSYGGMIATQTVRQSFGKRQRTEHGHRGGVVRIVYMCAFLPKVGESLMGAFGIADGGPFPPFVNIDDRKMVTMSEPERRFYSDLGAEEQQRWCKVLVSNALRTQTTPVTHAAYLHHPITYLFCENDEAILLEFQERMVEDVEGMGVQVVRESCAAGHSPYLSMPKRVLQVVESETTELFWSRCSSPRQILQCES